MKALVFKQHGDLDQVVYTDIEKPSINDDHVLLKVKAAALNHLDLWVLQGWPGLNLKLPHIMGSDGAGEIAATGANVKNFKVGDRVAVNPTIADHLDEFSRSGRDNLSNHFGIIGEHGPGFYAEYAAVPARNCLALPTHVSFEQAAAASLVFLTAWHSLIVRGNLRAGETILIVGAGGGVNTAAIQIAKFAGAERIYVVGSSAEKLQQAKELGADVIINRHDDDWSKTLYKATQQQGVDVVVDNVGAATFNHSLRVLKKGGRLLTVGNTSGATFEIDNRVIFGKHLSIIGSTMGTSTDYQHVMQLVFDGKLKPVIDRSYPLSEGLSALQRMQEGEMLGKLILVP